MNIHKNARSCPASRELLVKRVFARECSVREASVAAGISDRRGREWVRRARADEPLTDRSSRPHRTRATGQAMRGRVLALRREWRTVRQIAVIVKLSASTVARICRSAGLSRLRHLEPPPTPVRYERERPGELLHVDIKRLGRFDRVGHRITRQRSFGSKKQGFEFVYVAVDDFTRLSYVDILADERSAGQPSCRDSSPAFVPPWGSSTNASARTHRRRTARPNGSFRRSCANGHIASRTRPRTSVGGGSRLICISTTTIAHILPSRTIHQSVAWIGTTS